MVSLHKMQLPINILFTFRVLTERALEVQDDVFACFVDYQKAIDKVRQEYLASKTKGLSGGVSQHVTKY